MIRFRLLAFAGLLGFGAVSASAQWSAYATAAATDYGYTSSGGYNSGNLEYKGISGGLLGGAFYNFPIQSRVTVGVDLRADYSPGNKGGEFFAVDLRVGFVPKKNRLRPFFGLGGGVITTSRPSDVFNSGTRSTGGGLQLDFGLDVRLTEHFDYRVLDYGASAGGSAGTGFAATGIVYHF